MDFRDMAGEAMTTNPSPKRPTQRLFSSSTVCGLISLVRKWRRLAFSRRELPSLSSRFREDIGVRYEDAWKEMRKWFWTP